MARRAGWPSKAKGCRAVWGKNDPFFLPRGAELFTLLRAAQTMTDRVVANQLKALADDYERRAEKASRDDAARALTRSAASAEPEWLA